MQLGLTGWRLRLFTKPELIQEGAVAGEVVFAQVGQQAFAAAYHGHQTPVGGKVLPVFL